MANVKEVVEEDTVVLVLANKFDMVNDDKDKHEASRLKGVLDVNGISFDFPS